MTRCLRWWWKMVVAVVLMSACEHKELCFDHGHMVDLEVCFDWAGAPEASPRTMVVQFFKTDGSHFYRQEFISREGGKIRLEAGEYKILFHNGEMEAVDERGKAFEEYELVAGEQGLLAPMGRAELSAPPRPEDTEQQPVCGAPERVWGGKHDYLEVVRGVVGQTVTLYPGEATREYTIEVRHVENMTPEVDVSAALTGMAGSLRLMDGMPSGSPVTIPLALERVDEHTLVARFASFGHCPSVSTKHVFSIYTSEKVFFNFDVTHRLHKATDPRHVRVVIDEEVKLPLPGTGMKPSVSGWDEVINVDIDMN